jgi:hypothetical protein
MDDDTDWGEKLGQENLPYLAEINQQLLSGHASVLVGAGFSKNASPKSQNCSGFLDWNELGDLFYDKLYSSLQENCRPEKKYMNVLKLAQEVESAFGRPVLNSLLKQAIPDTYYDPSELHTKLLRLPWTDVFTTNYDTLLERTTVSVIERRYDIVTKKDDLVFSQHPRIIKLHGSFPSTTPFIITEEDYRKYPFDFAPFVNTVQQSMLENTLCLIGFSGDDPNFLHWIGWIRDNLGSSCESKIYLIGVFSFTSVQTKILEQRNIIIINIPVNKNDGKNIYYKALESVFTYFIERGQKISGIQWPFFSVLIPPKKEESDSEIIKKITAEWKKQRLSYPGWVIVPESKREFLYMEVQKWIQYFIVGSDIQETFFCESVYELLWRLEKCLYPLDTDTAKLSEQAIQIWDADTDYKIDDVYIFVKLSLLRFYRHKGKGDNWKSLSESLEKQINSGSAKMVAEFHYEKTLNALYRINLPQLGKELDSWQLNDSLPYYNCKKAAILAELGDSEQAEQIIRKAIELNHRQQNLLTSSNDYTLKSEESYMIFLHDALLFQNAIPFNSNNEKQKYQDLHKTYNNRLSELKSDECDPWNEIQYFSLSLIKQYVPFKKEKEEFTFDLRLVKTQYITNNNTEQILAYNFLLFSESAGIPYKIRSNRKSSANILVSCMPGVIQRLVTESFFWCFSMCVRIAQQNFFDLLCTRKNINSIPVSDIDRLCDDSIETFKENSNKIHSDNKCEVTDSYSLVLRNVIPEILSRFCVRCSQPEKEKLFDFLEYVYKELGKYQNISLQHFTLRLLQSFSYSQQAGLLERILQLPIPPVEFWDNAQCQEKPVAPCSCLNPDLISKYITNTTALKEDALLGRYFCAAESYKPDIKEWGMKTLVFLFFAQILSEEQQNRFADILWREPDEKGFPFQGYYKYFVYLKLPHPSAINPEQLFKKYVQVVKVSPFMQNGTIITQSVDHAFLFFHELYCSASLSKGMLSWTSDEFIIVCKKIIECWNVDKELLDSKENGTIKNSVYGRYNTLVKALAEMLFNYQTIVTDDVAHIMQSLLQDFDKYHIPHAALMAVCSSFSQFEITDEKVTEEIRIGLSSGEETVVNDGLQAVITVLKNNDADTAHRLEKCSEILEYLGMMLLYRKSVGLSDALQKCTRIVTEFSWAFTGMFEKNILHSLQSLEEDSVLENDGVIWEPEEKILVRQNAAGLAYQIYVRCKTDGKTQHDVITKWQTVCTSEGEFAEVRNAWQDERL